MIDTDLRAHLIDLGTEAGSNVHTGNPPQGVQMPLVVIRRSAGDQRISLGGTKLFQKDQFEISVAAKDYQTAFPIVNAIRAELHGFRGYLGGTGGTAIQSCRCISFPQDQSLVDGDQVMRFFLSSYLFVYSEA